MIDPHICIHSRLLLKAQARIAELTATLGLYGNHQHGCEAALRSNICTCGWQRIVDRERGYAENVGSVPGDTRPLRVP